MSLIKGFFVDDVTVKVYDTREDMGKNAAIEAARVLKQLIKLKKNVNVVFAAAPSQNEFLDNLIKINGIDWTKINGYHLDEYIGLPEGAEQSFRNFLKKRLFDNIPIKNVHYINGRAKDLEKECKRYACLIKNKIDLVFVGFGENGHIAFNDPGFAKFKDKKTVKVVELDEVCRQQQVNDKCFDNLKQVPKKAITLTMSAFLTAKHVFCIVPAKTKANAVKETLLNDINENCPASAIRLHKDVVLYCDSDSASLLNL